MAEEMNPDAHLEPIPAVALTEKTLMSISIYLRVSSRDQDARIQRAEIEKYLANHNITEPVTWFEDKQSGKDLERQALKELQKAIFAGEIKTVIVWKLDRLSRNLRDGINLLADWTERGIRIISVTQQIDLSGAIGRMVVALLLGIAEMERENIRERQAAGIALAKERGVYSGRRRGTTKGNPERARELESRGLEPEEIARALGVSLRTVSRYLAPPNSARISSAAQTFDSADTGS